MNSSTYRSVLYCLVGGYLLYTAYGLLRNRVNEVPTDMPMWLSIVFIALFAGVGITMLVSAWKIWKRVREDQDQVPVNLEADETKSEKDGPGSDK